MNQPFSGKVTLKLAIVGGGRACAFFLKLVSLGNLPFLQLDIIGVCDINTEAEGYRMAKQMGIYTTTDFKDLFTLKELDGIIQMTNDRDVLVELIQLRPARIGILEHNIGRLIRNLFMVDQQLRSAEQKIVFEKEIRISIRIWDVKKFWNKTNEKKRLFCREFCSNNIWGRLAVCDTSYGV